MDISGLFSIKGRSALVTGGSAGIGRHIATGLAAAGAKVYICARNGPKVEAAAQDISASTGGTVIGLSADLSSKQGIEALAADIASKENALHILVNNAGTLTDAPFGDYPEDGWDDVMDLNLKAPFFLTQTLLPQLRAGASADHHAAVINIGSVGALKIGPREVYAYQASKAGIHWLSRSLARKLAPEHITVNVIAPGFFESDMTVISSDQMRDTVVGMVPRRRVGAAEDMAGAAIFLSSKAGTYLTGSVLPVEGGLSI